MAEKEFEIKVRLSGSKQDLIKYKKTWAKAMEEEITPEIEKFAREFLLYKDMRGKTNWQDFRTKHSGIITAAILDRIDKSRVDLSKKDSTRIHVDKLTGKPGTEVVIEGRTSEAANKEFEKKSFREEDIFKAVTKLKPEEIEKIFEMAAQRLLRGK